jgi:hypothetical protein
MKRAGPFADKRLCSLQAQQRPAAALGVAFRQKRIFISMACELRPTVCVYKDIKYSPGGSKLSNKSQIDSVLQLI